MRYVRHLGATATAAAAADSPAMVAATSLIVVSIRLIAEYSIVVPFSSCVVNAIVAAAVELAKPHTVFGHCSWILRTGIACIHSSASVWVAGDLLHGKIASGWMNESRLLNERAYCTCGSFVSPPVTLKEGYFPTPEIYLCKPLLEPSPSSPSPPRSLGRQQQLSGGAVDLNGPSLLCDMSESTCCFC